MLAGNASPISFAKILLLKTLQAEGFLDQQEDLLLTMLMTDWF